MKKVEVLGSGCKKCIDTAEAIQETADKLGISIQLEHVTDPVEIATRGIIQTPAVMIDGLLVHKGSRPSESEIKTWL